MLLATLQNTFYVSLYSPPRRINILLRVAIYLDSPKDPIMNIWIQKTRSMFSCYLPPHFVY